jgi:ABC-type Co2+ transport system permease subunit
MHIEPGVVEGAKMALGAATGLGVVAYALKSLAQNAKNSGALKTVVQLAACTLATLMFFEVFWRQSVGVSEVHLIFGATLYLLFGLGPTAIGLSLGLLAQGLLFEPSDLAQYGMNVTTLLVPLFVVNAYVSKRIPQQTSFVQLNYQELLKISAMYQGGIIAWVAFWVVWGQGVTAASMSGIASFATLYAAVILAETAVSVALLYGFKRFASQATYTWFTPRLGGSH